MTQTLIQKIVAAHSSERCRPGDVVWLSIDLATARDFGGANVVKNLEREYPETPVEDPSATLFTFDCQAPANTIGYANNQHIVRTFAKKHGIRIYDVNGGIGSHLIMDRGHCIPGSTAVGTDSHLNLVGAIGALGLGMGDRDIAFAFKTQRVWFKVPETIEVRMIGTFDYPTTPKDMALLFLGNLGPSGALNAAVEFCGAAVESLNLSGRITLSSLVTEAGGVAGLISPSEAVLDELKVSKGNRERVVKRDAGAPFVRKIEIDVSGLQPKVAMPGNPCSVVNITEVAGTPIDSVLIGSCTNGRYEDIVLAADILEGRKVKNGVMLKIAPATREIYGRLLKEGIISKLYDAGAIIVNQGCAGCAAGQVGMTGKGEVQISTGNRNFPGKQGAGDTYLASPVVAAYSAIYGEIRVPE
ncbi:MAG: 3-isopropylmalate dehydratase large subunit [Candidatus Coatesbacteria bacterium]|nr:3-isopropylmalate dehydratase large subunit [Candidatus Coatesbacteria bacterium]